MRRPRSNLHNPAGGESSSTSEMDASFAKAADTQFPPKEEASDAFEQKYPSEQKR